MVFRNFIIKVFIFFIILNLSTCALPFSSPKLSGILLLLLRDFQFKIDKSDYSFTVNKAIQEIKPELSESVQSCTSNPDLPSGLSLSQTQCIISGTPLSSQVNKKYTISASLNSTQKSIEISIEIFSSLPARIQYPVNHYRFQRGTTVENVSPETEIPFGFSFFIHPNLPNNLFLNTNTGQIHGTPVDTLPPTLFTITGKYLSETFSTSITIEIIDSSPPSNLYYPTTVFTFYPGIITPISPVYLGSNPVSFSISPALPSGLFFSSTTGTISGNPTKSTGKIQYTITASNAYGTTFTSIFISIIFPYTISGTVLGLEGELVLLLNESEKLFISKNSGFQFLTTFVENSTFSIKIIQKPINQTCTLVGGSGTIKFASINNVLVNCNNGIFLGGNVIYPLNLKGEVDMNLKAFFAGDIDSSSHFKDGIGNSARFEFVNDITMHGFNQIIVLEDQRLRQLNPSTRTVSTLANIKELNFFSKMTSDGSSLYFLNLYTCNVFKLNMQNYSVSNLAGSKNSCGDQDSEIGTNARFSIFPQGITADENYIYISDTWNNKIKRIHTITGAVKTIAGSGAFGTKNGNADQASFYYPESILYYNQKIYVYSSSENKIRVINLFTNPITVSFFSGSGNMQGNLDGPANIAQFAYISKMITDGNYIYALDFGNRSIRKIHIDTGHVLTLSGNGSYTSSIGSGGISGTSSFRSPYNLITDGKFIYVSDIMDDIIRRVE